MHFYTAYVIKTAQNFIIYAFYIFTRAADATLTI